MSEPSGGDKFAQSAKNGLTSKIGGIPLYIYGGGFVIGFYLYKKWVASKTPVVAPIDPNLNHPAGLPSLQTGSDLPTGSSGFVTGSGGINTSNASGLLDPVAWVAQGTAYLAALGYDGTTANQTLNSYVSGVQPTGAAQRLTSLVLSRYGSPASQQAIQPGDALNSPKLVRIIRRADNPAIFGQYSDGSVHWFPNPSDLYGAAKSTGSSDLWDGSNPVIQSLSNTDPLWNAAGIQFSNVYPFIPITTDTPKGAQSVVTKSQGSAGLGNAGDQQTNNGNTFYGWGLVGAPSQGQQAYAPPIIPGTYGAG